MVTMPKDDNVRERARKLLDEAVPKGVQIRSDGATEKRFTDLTGGASVLPMPHKSRQQYLMDVWKKGGIMTACNEFVNWYARALGADVNLGRFDVEHFLQSIDKEYAWVQSAEDRRPKYGDILRHTSFHMDVALDFEDGDLLIRAGAGDGTGPITEPRGKKVKDGAKLVGGYDVITRTRGKTAYQWRDLQGWVDVELFFGGKPPDPSPRPAEGAAGSKSGMWFDKLGVMVHPNAPSGGGGPGLFRQTGSMIGNPFDRELPHPFSPGARLANPMGWMFWDQEDMGKEEEG
jgi:hypothetical protein